MPWLCEIVLWPQLPIRELHPLDQTFARLLPLWDPVLAQLFVAPTEANGSPECARGIRTVAQSTDFDRPWLYLIAGTHRRG